MSYWTYTDLFEEPGPPPTPFHGGFGLMNREGIRKPAYFAYKYLHALQGGEVSVADTSAFVARDAARVAAVIWDWEQPDQRVSNKPFYTRLVPATPAAPIAFCVAHIAPGNYRLRIYRTGYRANDPLSAYVDMGMPASLTAQQLGDLQSLTRDVAETDNVIKVGKSGAWARRVPMRSNDVILVTLDPVSHTRH
jgi:xylan 1,4-beta-xylosidase